MATKEDYKGDAGKGIKEANQATLSYNQAHDGIELRFNAQPSTILQAKMRVNGFRPSKLKNMWYAANSSEGEEFAKEVVTSLQRDPEGPTMILVSSFDPIKPNLEKKEYSYVEISLKSGKRKDYIVFEPSKPKAEVIAATFAHHEFGEELLGVVVKPRMRIREARLLFEEGKIIVSKVGDRLGPKDEVTNGETSKEKTQSSINHSIYEKLLEIVPSLLNHLSDRGETTGKSKGKFKGEQDLHYEFTKEEESGVYIIALSNYYKRNYNDREVDEEGTRYDIRIFPDKKLAEVIMYTPPYGSRKEVYTIVAGKLKADPKLKKDLNKWCDDFLSNAIAKGHRINLSDPNRYVDQVDERLQIVLKKGKYLATPFANGDYESPFGSKYRIVKHNTGHPVYETIDISFPIGSKVKADISILRTITGGFKFYFQLYNKDSLFGEGGHSDVYKSRKDALQVVLAQIKEKISTYPQWWTREGVVVWMEQVNESLDTFAASEGIDLNGEMPDSGSFLREVDSQYAIKIGAAILKAFERYIKEDYKGGEVITRHFFETWLVVNFPELFDPEITWLWDEYLLLKEKEPIPRSAQQASHQQSELSAHSLQEAYWKSSDEDYPVKEPWEMKQDEFLTFCKNYIQRFSEFPVDILDMYDYIIRLFPAYTTFLLQENPTISDRIQVAKIAHALIVVKALVKGREVPQEVLNEYTWMDNMRSEKLTKRDGWLNYGYDLTDFKSKEDFVKLLDIVGINKSCKECKQLDKNNFGVPLYIWEGLDITIITRNNPLVNDGKAGFMNITGTKDQTLKAVEFIDNHTGTKGELEGGYIKFENILCFDSDDPFFKPSDTSPSPEGGKQPQRTPNHTLSGHSATDVIYQKPKFQFSEVIEVPRDLITTRPKMFQGRETDYAFETVDKIVREGFDKSQDPIVVWKDPIDGRLIVISGHSRWEASRRLYERGDTSLAMMPVKIHKGTLHEAMDFALLESNRAVTQEGLKSDLKAYKYAKQKGFNREYLQGIFKPESRLKLLEDISYLDANGSFITYLDTESEKSFPYLQRNAHWVGQIRKQYPALTKAHEEEMFRYLYNLNGTAKKSPGKKLVIPKADFFDLIEKKISRIDFDPERPLNLDEVISTSALTDPAKERIKEIEKEIAKLEQERRQKDELIARAIKENKESLIDNFRQRQADINQIITRKIIEKEKIEREIGILERTTVDLFSFINNENSSKSSSNQHESATTSTASPNDHPDDYLDKVIAIMHEKFGNAERPTKKQIESVANELGISSMGKMWEAVELSWLLWYKMIYNDRISFEVRLARMIRFWDKVQPTYEYSDSSKEIYKQYSTPGPIAAIVSQYTGMQTADSVFEPSAGNGLLVLGAKPSKAHVNEIDNTRLASLKFQGFKKITNYNATQPFADEMAKAYQVVVTNPPFAQWSEEQFDKDLLIQKYFDNHVGLSHHLRLEHVMAGLALHCLQDSGRAAIIIMNHIYFEPNGYIAKYRPFFNWLYRHYYVDDVININSFNLYNKQGAIQRVMLILIRGRKARPHGVAPRKEVAPHLDSMVSSFEELWKRVSMHIGYKIDKVIEQLKIAIAV